MPTAAEFRDTASKFDVLGQASSSARVTMLAIGHDTGVRGGAYEQGIERGLDTTLLNLGSVTARCADGAAEARRRATVCDRYSAEMVEYRRRLDAWFASGTDTVAAPQPVPPTRPAWWVDEG